MLSMKKKIRRMTLVVLVVIFTASTFMLLRQWKDNADGKTAYEEAIKTAMHSKPKKDEISETTPEQLVSMEEKESVWVPAAVEDDPVMEQMAQINVDALRQINEDVLGWIRIPDTQIDYPLVQGEDNDFYLRHTWEKTENSVGSIFLECLNKADMTDFNTIIYGHNMKNNAMFGDLENYSLTQYWKTHPYVYIALDSGVYRYEIFSFSRASVESITYGLEFQWDQTKEKFLKNAADQSWIDTGITPAVTDRVITLSTCSGGDYSSRYVVQARLPMVEITQ